MNIRIQSHIDRWWYKIVIDTLSCQCEVINQSICFQIMLLIINLNLCTLTIFFVDPDVEIFFKSCGRVFEQIISQSLSFQSMIVLLIGIELERVVKLLVELKVIAGDFDGEVSVLLRLLYWVELFEWGFLKIAGVDLLNRCL